MSALVLQQVVARRGARTVLSGVDAMFPAGRVTAVIGPNGAGKSTMLEVAAGLLAPASGTVTLGGVAIRDLPRRALARRRAYLPQRAGVDWPISVERVVALGLTPRLPAFGPLPPHLRGTVAAALGECGLTDLADRAATSLSGGELARTMLARAIVGDPDLLVVDEPTAGLDPPHAIDAMRRLRARADAGATVIVSVHEIDLALRFADAIVGIAAGRIVLDAAADAVGADDLAALYGVAARVTRDRDGVGVRFL